MRNEDEKLREAARMLSRNCEERLDSCKGCLFCRDNLSCKINGIPVSWDSDFGLDHSVDTNKKVWYAEGGGKKYGTPTDTPTATDTPTDTPTTRAEILDAAKAIVTGDREKQYGSPEDNFAAVAQMWEVYLRGQCVGEGADVRVAPEDVAMMMVLLKVGRLMTGDYLADNYVDICGYVACAGEIAGKGTTTSVQAAGDAENGEAGKQSGENNDAQRAE